ncbi:MAG: DUF362 domain-containing protein [Anaerolineae bacterium]|nr:ferredoxin family protein [Chloroflexota bacterium]
MTSVALPVFHPERCRGCALCIDVCAQGVFAVAAGKAQFHAPQRCIYCGECELACPEGAVELYYEVVSRQASVEEDSNDRGNQNQEHAHRRGSGPGGPGELCAGAGGESHAGAE